MTQLSTTAELCSTILKWARTRPSHVDLVRGIFIMSVAVSESWALTDKCRNSIVDQISELVNEIEQDFINQKEQA